MSISPLGELSRAEARILGNVARVTNSLSIGVCILMISIFLAIRYYARPLADRVIFRLTFYMCIIDSGYAAAQIVQNDFIKASPICTSSAWALVFFNLLSSFFRVLVAVHLQLVFIHQKTRARRYERYYIIGAFLVATGCSVAPAIANMYGWVPSQWFCWYKNDGTIKSLLWQWFSYYLWLSLAVLYCLVVVILVFRRIAQVESEVLSAIQLPTPQGAPDDNLTGSNPLAPSASHLSPSHAALHNYRISRSPRTAERQLEDHPFPTGPNGSTASLPQSTGLVYLDGDSAAVHSRSLSEGNIAEKSQPLARKCLQRVIWYPIIPIVTQTMVITNAFINYYSDSINMPVYISATALAGLQGVLTGIVFIFDPSVRRAHEELAAHWVERYYIQYSLLMSDQYHLVGQASFSNGPSDLVAVPTIQLPLDSYESGSSHSSVLGLGHFRSGSRSGSADANQSLTGLYPFPIKVNESSENHLALHFPPQPNNSVVSQYTDELARQLEVPSSHLPRYPPMLTLLESPRRPLVGRGLSDSLPAQSDEPLSRRDSAIYRSDPTMAFNTKPRSPLDSVFFPLDEPPVSSESPGSLPSVRPCPMSENPLPTAYTSEYHSHHRVTISSVYTGSYCLDGRTTRNNSDGPPAPFGHPWGARIINCIVRLLWVTPDHRVQLAARIKRLRRFSSTT
ncbi:hypothetical protein H4R33_002337 [Dimargaris cristalligena]|uniref:G-protein coupled receptors family 2 profile 2 domain-containing protein n=1 Tax=Dimargaris cristalligena TaxID=215637 RepID=A0A4V1J4T6_9FUNG|nr:hypothetical protein H4R33_002337 [Dimargaris cristalligena]RKP36689.1 hypothetical protein BJ085DRAFT_28394 [Dimargaris cristalligena]|eukprot:RKP36689.1 hypothetical protein BJ085DRAFT_28394 [Dimargaris cristalligena]